MSAQGKMLPPPAAPRRFAFPRPEIRVLGNGLKVYFIADRRLPLVSFDLEVFAGAAYDDAATSGAASLTATLLREGAGGRSSQEIARLVDNVGGSLSASANDDTASASATFMKSHAGLGLELLAGIVREPEFAEEELDRQKAHLQSSLALQYTQPEYLARTAAFCALLGSHPYARPTSGTPRSVPAITREQIQAFHQRYFTPSNTLLAISGDLGAEEAFAQAERYFGGWKGAPADLPELAAPPENRRQVVVIDLPNATQTQIAMGLRGMSRQHPCFLGAAMANEAFGGSFNSRLNLKLRANEGLTYGASSELVVYRASGTWSVGTFTRNEKTAAAIEFIFDLLREWKQNPITTREFEEALRYRIGIFGLSLETAEAVAGRVLSAAVYGLGDDYWPTYLETLQSVKMDDCARFVHEFIDPERVTIAVSGKADEIAPALEAFGPVTVIPAPEFDPLSPNLRLG